MKERFLMCAPRHFEVAYVINPWMEGNIARGSNPAAAAQWKALVAMLCRYADVDSITAGGPIAGFVLDLRPVWDPLAD